MTASEDAGPRRQTPGLPSPAPLCGLTGLGALGTVSAGHLNQKVE